MASAKQKAAQRKKVSAKDRASKTRASKTRASKARGKRTSSVKKKMGVTMDTIAKVVKQAKEPLGLLETLKEESLGRAGYLLGVAAGVASNVSKDMVVGQLRDLSDTVGIASKDDLNWIESKFSDFERRLEQIEEKLGLTDVVQDVEDQTEDESDD